MPELALTIFLSMVFAQVWVMLIQPDFILDFMGPVIDKIKSQKIKHLLTCSTCMSGQFALWFYLLFHMEHYHILEHLSVIAVTIWLSAITGKLIF
jgi:hypothetical protein